MGKLDRTSGPQARAAPERPTSRDGAADAPTAAPNAGVEPSTLDALAPDPENRRVHPDRNIAMIAAALQEVGAARSIVIDEAGNILAGNGVATAARQIGLSKLRVVDATGDEIIAVRRRGLTSDQKRSLAIYDNRTGDLAEWNIEQLGLDKANGLDLRPWFSEAEEAALFGHALKTGRTDPDDVPNVRATDIARGHVFALGAHRLLCGDSAKTADVARFMGHDVAALVYTDPPYGVKYDGGTKIQRKLIGDDTTDLYEPACRHAAAFSDDRAPLYLWHAGVKGIAAAAAAAAAGYEIRCEIVWNKNHAQFGSISAQYKQKHEPLYYCFKRGQAPRWFGPTNEVTVWDCDRSAKNEFHPTQKPVELAVRAIMNSSEVDRIVLDLFLGSGATVIACEQASRHCYGVELDPSYCQVIIDRWEAFTGSTAQKIGEIDHARA